MTVIAPSSRFHRTIKKLSRCIFGQEQDLSAEHEALLQANESLMGVYRADSRSDDLLFTDKGFIFTDHHRSLARRIAYTEIEDVRFPLPASDSVLLYLRLTDSTLIEIRVVGRQDNYRDVFEVGRFFARVVEDAKGI